MSNIAASAQSGTLDFERLARGLGSEAASLVATISEFAHQRGLKLYLAGGVVRDLLLGAASQDLDFVLEADAIQFARDLAQRCGGAVETYPSFGTATWTPDQAAAARSSVKLGEAPLHIDFARARSESYTRPAALPTVTRGDILADMRRRDFSINALALQLDAASKTCRLIDPCRGLADLNARLIRVLHPDSFADDPTRILRAWRFAVRLQFAIESQTGARMQAALPWLGRTTGARLRKEIDLLLREVEPDRTLAQLQALGALTHIDPAFHVSESTIVLLRRYRNQRAGEAGDSLGWCLLLAALGEQNARAVCQRLELTKDLCRAICASATLLAKAAALDNPRIRPSRIVPLLDSMPVTAIHAGQLLLAGDSIALKRLAAYLSSWRNLRPGVTGADLKTMGLPPGPRYRVILDQLRSAWIDGDVKSQEQERGLLQRLLSQDV